MVWPIADGRGHPGSHRRRSSADTAGGLPGPTLSYFPCVSLPHLHPSRPHMLNYIWAGLIVSSFLFAIGYDVRDLSTDRFRNGEPLAVTVAFPTGYDSTARQVPVTIRIDPAAYGAFYHTDERPDSVYTGYLLQTREGRQLRF